MSAKSNRSCRDPSYNWLSITPQSVSPALHHFGMHLQTYAVVVILAMPDLVAEYEGGSYEIWDHRSSEKANQNKRHSQAVAVSAFSPQVPAMHDG
jgi:hypothetical protein